MSAGAGITSAIGKRYTPWHPTASVCAPQNAREALWMVSPPEMSAACMGRGGHQTCSKTDSLRAHS